MKKICICNFRFRPFALALILLSALPAVLLASGKATVAQKAEDFIKAAENHEMAAAALQESASTLLGMAREYRTMEYIYEMERRANVKNAGNQERRAGQMLATASQDMDNAAAAWEKAAAEHRRAGNNVKADEMKQNSEASRTYATNILRKAAEAYEFSAEAFSGNDLDQMAVSSRLAAQTREKLAQR